ncbi:MAG: oligosaccharide flippase family protein [Pyrinomonadaceae bacterium]
MLLIKNFFSLSLAELISKLVTFAAFAYLARVAGPEGFGFVEFAGAMLLCASLIVDQGFGPYGAREIARAPGRTPALVAEIVTARFVLAVAAYALVIAFALLVETSPIATRLMLIYGLSLLAMPLLLPWVFQGTTGWAQWPLCKSFVKQFSPPRCSRSVHEAADVLAGRGGGSNRRVLCGIL